MHVLSEANGKVDVLANLGVPQTRVFVVSALTLPERLGIARKQSFPLHMDNLPPFFSALTVSNGTRSLYRDSALVVEHYQYNQWQS